MSIALVAPIKRRRKRAGRDAKYLRFIRSLACLVCGPEEQRTATEAAHVGLRGLGQRSHDRETIPLCALHHRTGKQAIHVLGKHFFIFHGLAKIKILESLQALYHRG